MVSTDSDSIIQRSAFVSFAYSKGSTTRKRILPNSNYFVEFFFCLYYFHRIRHKGLNHVDLTTRRGEAVSESKKANIELDERTAYAKGRCGTAIMFNNPTRRGKIVSSLETNLNIVHGEKCGAGINSSSLHDVAFADSISNKYYAFITILLTLSAHY